MSAFREEQWTLLGNQILNRRSGIISIHVIHPRLYKCLQVHVIANARLVRCVLVRLSLNWPKYERDSGKWKILTRNVATYATIPIPQRAHATDEELTCPPALWRNGEPCLNQMPHRKTTGLVCLQDIWTLYQYVINWMGQFTVRDLSYCIVHLLLTASLIMMGSRHAAHVR